MSPDFGRRYSPLSIRDAAFGARRTTLSEVKEILEAALAALQANDAEVVEGLCESLVGTEGEADGCHLLALLSNQQGAPEAAQVHIERAISLSPQEPCLHFFQGTLLRALGRVDQAMSSFRLALMFAPDYPDAHFNLGNILRERGRYLEAVAHYKFLMERDQDAVEARLNYAKCMEELGRQDEAEEQLRHLVDGHPEYPDGHLNLGLVLHAKSKSADALKHFKRALKLRPNFSSAQNGIGLALSRLGRNEEAEAAYRDALQSDPNNADAHSNLASLLQRLGRLDEAIAEGKEAVRLNPALAVAYNNLGLAFVARGEIADARRVYAQALALEPDNAKTHSNFVMCLCYDTELAPEHVFAAHQDWNARFAPDVPTARIGNRSLTRKLRVGYVSSDFRAHSVAFFILPILLAHDRSQVEVTCYADLEQPDDLTTMIQGATDNWRDITDMSDEVAASLIRSEKIDVLVDLAGHTAGNRLRMFALRPAPVQVTWIGYPNTTGLAAMDARLTDAEADPPGMTEAWHSEKLIRLPTGFLCYMPPPEVGEATPLPAGENGPITFGSFNNLAKLSEATVAVWAQVLHAVPDSKLLLKARSLGDAGTRSRIQSLFAAQGVGTDRLELRGFIQGVGNHLDHYGCVDIALDTFPYNGTTTTCEALWMGVPLVTLAGQAHAGRVGLSLLTRVGLEDLVARDEDDYVAIAKCLAADRTGLAVLRRTLRARVAASPLTDAKAVAGAVETAYRDLWCWKLGA